MKIRSLICLFAFLFSLLASAQVPQWQQSGGPPPAWLQYLGTGIDGGFTAPTTGGFSAALSQAYSVPASSPYTITPTFPGRGGWSADAGVFYASNGAQLTAVASGPTHGQYTVAAGVYTFAAADEGVALTMDFFYTTPGSTVSMLNGDFYFTSFTVPSGTTITTSGLTVHALNACTISGTLTAVGAGYGGGSGGGGGGGSTVGYWGFNSALSALQAITLQTLPMGVGVSGGQYGSTPGGAGSAGQPGFDATGSAGQSYPNRALVNASAIAFRGFLSAGGYSDGLGIGGAAGGMGAGSTAQGGAPGGGIVLICGSIGGSGTINANGSPGANATANNTGAGGGGGGGGIILSSQQPMTFTGTLNVAGGAGGACGSFTGCGSGGAGGAGWIYAVSGW